MIHTLILAATLCGAETTVQSADALFSKADSAISLHDVEGAKNDYRAGVEQLSGTVFFIQDPGCDPSRYAFERFIATLHSLAVAAAAGVMTPFDSYVHMGEMTDAFFKQLPATASEYLAERYPQLNQRWASYTTAIQTASRAQRIAAHNPVGPNCQRPNLEVDVLQTAQASWPNIARGGAVAAEVTSVVKVGLGSDGTLLSATVTQSSGNLALDQAALKAARDSTYLPAVKDCVRVPSSYDFKVTFDPNG